MNNEHNVLVIVEAPFLRRRHERRGTCTLYLGPADDARVRSTTIPWDRSELVIFQA